MPRKSIPGGKANRTSASKEQNGVDNSAITSDTKTVSAQAAPVHTTPETKVNQEPSAALLPTAPETKVSQQSKVAPPPRKFEVMKTEARKNVVPINLEDEIRRRAYELYQQRGSGTGSEAEDWFTAEREIRQRYRQHSA